MKVQNMSDEVQCFANIPAFQPQEVREVSKEEGEYLSHSPFIKVLDGDEEVKKAKKK